MSASMIFVSAGHHPSAPGASFDGLVEHTEAVRWVTRICELLGPRAVRVPYAALETKVAFIRSKAQRNSVAIEIHFNDAVKWWDRDGDGVVDEGELLRLAKGSETLFYPGTKVGADDQDAVGRELATLIQEGLGRIFPPNRGAKEGWYRCDPKRGPDYILARTPCPTVIIEPEFIHRKAEIKAGLEPGCAAIVEALLEFTNRRAAA